MRKMPYNSRAVPEALLFPVQERLFPAREAKLHGDAHGRRVKLSNSLAHHIGPETGAGVQLRFVLDLERVLQRELRRRGGGLRAQPLPRVRKVGLAPAPGKHGCSQQRSPGPYGADLPPVGRIPFLAQSMVAALLAARGAYAFASSQALATLCGAVGPVAGKPVVKLKPRPLGVGEGHGKGMDLGWEGDCGAGGRGGRLGWAAGVWLGGGEVGGEWPGGRAAAEGPSRPR